jgi:hypothetical protein
MWEVVTSHGHRVLGIQHESDARRVLHNLGITTMITQFRYSVTDNRGQQFVAEIRHHCPNQPAPQKLPTYR